MDRESLAAVALSALVASAVLLYLFCSMLGFLGVLMASVLVFSTVISTVSFALCMDRSIR